MTFATPIESRYFEDYVTGAVHEFGSVRVDEKEVIEFATRYDPQDFHVDPVAAKDSAFGGLIASGWHTAGMMMRLLTEHFVSKVASMGSPGVDELRWALPVRPGDTLSVRTTILEANRSRSKPDRGIVRTQVDVLNQRKEVVMSMKTIGFFRCRET